MDITVYFWYLIVVNLFVPPEPPWPAPAAQRQPQVRSEDATGFLPADYRPDADGSSHLPGHHQTTIPGQAPLPPCQHSSHQGRMYAPGMDCVIVC